MNRREILKTTLALATGVIPAGLAIAGSTKEPDQFFTHEELMEIVSRRGIKELTWDFAASLGDTIKEKYETLTELIKNSCHNQDWMVASPEIAAMFEVCHRFSAYSNTFQPAPFDPKDDYAADKMRFVGKTSGIRLYKDPAFTKDYILLGNKTGFVKIRIKNYII